MRELAKITARLKGGEYDGVMIIKTVWKREPESVENSFEPEIIKENKRMLVCRAFYNNESLTTTMLLHPADGAVVPQVSEMDTEEGDNRAVFNREDVLEFVAEVGDTNPIHQLEVPVVPGMLLLEYIKNHLTDNIKMLELSFRNAVMAGDRVEMQTEGGQVSLTGRKEFVTGKYYE